MGFPALSFRNPLFEQKTPCPLAYPGKPLLLKSQSHTILDLDLHRRKHLYNKAGWKRCGIQDKVYEKPFLIPSTICRYDLLLRFNSNVTHKNKPSSVVQ